MAVANSDLVLLGAASRPTDDASTSGGAIAADYRPVFTQFSASAVAAVLSDGADTRVVRITGRLASGVEDTEDLTLNGTTEVVGAKTFERILEAKIQTGGASGTRTVTVRQGSGGSAIGTIPVNELGFYAMFRGSLSDTNGVQRYEKAFYKNLNGSSALLSAVVKLTADPQSKMKIGVATAKGDTGSVTNRKTAPAGVTFVDDGVAASVPTGSLGAGETIGVWVEQTLTTQGEGPFKSTFTTEVSGSTT